MGIDLDRGGCYAGRNRRGARIQPPTGVQQHQDRQLRSSDHALNISEQIERARTRLIALAGLLVAIGFFASGLSHSLTDPSADSLYLWSLVGGGLIGLAALGLSLFGTRRAGALVLAGGLMAVTTWQLLSYRVAFEVGLAAYVGVLLVAVVGARPPEALIATLATVAVGLYSYLNSLETSPTFQGAAAIIGLLSGTGITLSWLHDNLLRAIGQLEVSSARLQRLSHQDPLTRLGNRRLFDEQVGRQLEYSSTARPLALVIIDVDQLKSINDRHGHPAGDSALQAVAEAIRASIRESDSAARIGGDEFGIVLPTGGVVGARRVAGRIHQILKQWNDNGVRLSVSIGIAEATDPQQAVKELLHTADSDMYAGRRGLLAGSSSSD